LLCSLIAVLRWLKRGGLVDVVGGRGVITVVISRVLEAALQAVAHRSARTLAAYRRALLRLPGPDSSRHELLVVLERVRSENGPAAAYQTWAAWRSIARHLREEDQAGVWCSAVDRIRWTSPRGRRSGCLTRDQIERLYEVARGSEIGVLDALYGLGLRAGELGAARVRGPVLEVDGKGRRRRDLLLVGYAVLAVGMTYREVFRTVRALGNRAGFRVRPHDLRHAHATISMEAGATLADVSEQLGHASASTTAVYLHGRGGTGAIALSAVGR
jgi:site-specific recombinase XerC